jgi:hypothetical protein
VDTVVSGPAGWFQCLSFGKQPARRQLKTLNKVRRCYAIQFVRYETPLRATDV